MNLLDSKAQKDGNCLKYLFVNNENRDVCLPPYLRIIKTQFVKKKQIPDISCQQYIRYAKLAPDSQRTEKIKR